MLGIVFGLGLLIALGIFLYVFTHTNYNRLGSSVWGFFCCMAATSVIIFLVGVIGGETLSEDSPVSTELRVLADGNSQSGSFFLGSGTIDDEQVFSFYRANSEGAWVLDYVHADVSSVVESDEPPHMIQYCDDYSTIPRWFEWPLPHSEPPSLEDCSRYDNTVFYVPNGSIKGGFTLDAQ